MDGSVAVGCLGREGGVRRGCSCRVPTNTNRTSSTRSSGWVPFPVGTVLLSVLPRACFRAGCGIGDDIIWICCWNSSLSVSSWVPLPEPCRGSDRNWPQSPNEWEVNYSHLPPKTSLQHFIIQGKIPARWTRGELKVRFPLIRERSETPFLTLRN